MGLAGISSTDPRKPTRPGQERGEKSKPNATCKAVKQGGIRPERRGR